MSRSRPALTALVAAVLFAVYRGFRAPSGWSANYFQPGFFDGFYRRALVGTLLTPLGCARFDHFVIQKIQLGVAIVALALLVRLAMRARETLVLAVVFASAAGGYFFHEAGYIDQLLWLITAAVIWAMARDRYTLAAAGVCFAVAVHEEALFTVLPVALAAMAVRPPRDRSCWLLLAVPPIALGAIGYVWFETAAPAAVFAFAQRAMTCQHPLLRSDYLEAYQSQFLGKWLGFYYPRRQLLLGVVPTVGVAAIEALAVGRALLLTRSRTALVFAACVSPLMLGVVALDTDRWLFLTVAQMVIVLIVASLHGRSAATMPPPLRRTVLLAFVALALVLRLDYFDGYDPRPVTIDGLRTFPAVVLEELRTIPRA